MGLMSDGYGVRELLPSPVLKAGLSQALSKQGGA
jgi:hypothetical protein